MPEVSVVLPSYRSEATLERCLTHLWSQSFQDRETILVDSSPEQDCETIVRKGFPDVRILRSPSQLLPHEALNWGVEAATGDLLVFLDPDAYPRADWLARLVASHQARGDVIVGAVACFGDRWIDRGAHLCKFDKWLPGGAPRPLQEGPTVNFLLPRELFDRYGPFPTRGRHGDTQLSWRLRAAGIAIHLEPTAVVEHHHLHKWSSLLRERYRRGKSFATVRLEREPASDSKLIWFSLLSLMPGRLLSQLHRVWKNARRASMARSYLLSFPVLTSGLYAWLLGESVTYIRRLIWSRGKPG